MKRVVCAVFDSALQSYLQPMFAPAIGGVIRSFVDEINRVAEDAVLSKHPEDYHLSYLADFDDEMGEFSPPKEGQRVLMRGKDAVRS